MKAFVYLGDTKRALEERPKPVVSSQTDAIVEAYETFGHAAETRALKVMLEA